MQESKSPLTRTIWILSLVSLFTDIASEMLYPVMPVYLQHIGFSIVLIGVLEGVAEAVAGLSKSYFGRLSDSSGKRLPFVRLGYAMSAISKPMMAVLTQVWWIFSARTLDRLGKGIRTGARDAMLSDEASVATKGSVFGFHRALDTLGAVLGPLIALIFLNAFPGQYKKLFLYAFFPGIMAIALTFLIRPKKRTPKLNRKSVSLLESFRYWKESPKTFRRIVSALILFAVFNSSDVFLLLKIKSAGFSDEALIGIYIFYNLIFAIFAYPLGRLGDRIGLPKVFVLGLVLFSATYAGFAFADSAYLFLFLFLLYGIYAAATDGIAKAWITNLVQKEDTATAIGTYTGFQSIAALLASSLAGWLWYDFGPAATFLSSSIVCILVAGYLTRNFIWTHHRG
jgi:MFS family permease